VPVREFVTVPAFACDERRKTAAIISSRNNIVLEILIVLIIEGIF
jgi:hypothetical protein